MAADLKLVVLKERCRCGQPLAYVSGGSEQPKEAVCRAVVLKMTPEQRVGSKADVYVKDLGTPPASVYIGKGMSPNYHEGLAFWCYKLHTDHVEPFTDATGDQIP